MNKLEVNKDYIYVHFDGEYDVFRICSKRAAIELGKGTKWCISTSVANHFDNYVDAGAIFYFLIRRCARNNNLDKIGVVYNNSITCYDRDDRVIELGFGMSN